jgi:putative transposase
MSDSTNSVEIFYRRHLPHYQPLGATFFVTFRLAGSIPAKIIERRARAGGRNHTRDHFERLDSILSPTNLGPRWLQKADVARIVQDAVKFRDGVKYDLYASCIMPTHVHMVFRLFDGIAIEIPILALNNAAKQNRKLVVYPVTEILGSLKKHTALEANKILGRRGAFWKAESYDHVVRDGGGLERILWYVLLNPQKAGLVKSWRDWPWTYCKPGLLAL